MTIQELYRLKNIRATKRLLSDRIETLKRLGEENADQIEELAKTIAILSVQELAEHLRLAELIESIDDREICKIIKLRFIDDLPWIEIAAEIAPLEKDASRTVPLKKIERFLKIY